VHKPQATGWQTYNLYNSLHGDLNCG
jgi:hypothetical protein